MNLEQPNNPNHVITTHPELIPNAGQTLGANETLLVQELGGDNGIARRTEQTLQVGGVEVSGIPSLVVKVGDEQTHIDIYVLDLRSKPSTRTDRNGNAIRDFGSDNGSPVAVAGDFALVSPSQDGESMQIRALYPGARWNIGRNHGSLGSDGHAPDTVSRDHCMIGLDENGGLIIENHDPSNQTTAFRPEAAGPVSTEEAVKLLSYADVLEGDQAQSAIAYTEQNPAGQKYTEALIKMSEEVGTQEVLDTAASLRKLYTHEMEKLGLQSSKYGESLSWAVWDLAKQRYLAEHPEESDSEYTLGDPLAKDEAAAKVLDDIVDRHLGWEYAQQYQQDQTTPATVRRAALHVIAHGERNASGQLRSKELTRLGRTLLI